MKKFFFGLGTGLLLTAIVGGISLYFIWDDYNTKLAQQKLTSQPWFPISANIEKKLKDREVRVLAVGARNLLRSSGCKIRPGVFLTSFHGIKDVILNHEPILVDNELALPIYQSHTDLDYVVLTTNPNITEKQLQFDAYNDFSKDQNVIVVGTPGTQKNYVQPARVVADATDTNQRVEDYAKVINGQYIQLGLSGGCVFTEDGNTLVGIVTGRYNDREGNDTFGEMTKVSMPLE